MANPDIGISIGLEGLQSYYRNLNQIDRRTGRAFDGVDSSVSSAAKSFDSLSDSFPGISSSLRLLANPVAGFAAGLAAASAAAVGFINTAADFETIQVQFETLTGDVDVARSALENLAAFSARTPFRFDEVSEAGRSLLAFGTEAGNLESTLQRLGDVAAGIGAPLGEIAEIYGKIQVQGRVFAEDINQLTGRGIPIIGQLAQQFGVAESEVKKLVEQGQVGFPQIERAFDDLTSAGGRFAGLTENLANTFSGQLSTLRDNATGAARSFGGLLLPAATSVLQTINELLGSSTAYSDQLEKERVEINLLVQRIGRYNDQGEDRLKLVNELNSRYPSFLGNLNAETVTNGQLRDRLEEVNEQYVNRIILQKEDERIADQAAELAERQREVIEDQIGLEEALRSAKEDFNIEVAEGLTLEQELLAVRKELDRLANEDGGFFSSGILDSRRRELLALSSANADYVKSLNRAGDAEEVLVGLQEDRDAVIKRLGISLENLTETANNLDENDPPEFINPKEIEKAQTLEERLDALGVSLQALQQFDKISEIFDAISLDSISASAERVKSDIIAVALEPSTPLNALQNQLSNINEALELIDPTSAGFVVLAEQASLLEARISLVNQQLEALKEGRDPSPIVFPVELQTDTLENLVITPEGLIARAAVELDLPDIGSEPLVPLIEAARILDVDFDLLNSTFSSTGQILDLMDSKVFGFATSLGATDFEALKLAASLEELAGVIGEQAILDLANGFTVLGSEIADVIQGTEGLGGAFDAFGRQTAAAVVESGTRIAGLYLMQLSLTAGPAGIPLFLAGAGLAGLSGLLPSLILGDQTPETIGVATPSLAGGNSIQGPSLATNQVSAVGLSDLGGSPAVNNTFQVFLDGEDITDAIATVQQTNLELTGG